MKIVLNILAISLLLVVGCLTQQESSFRAGYDFSGVDKIAIVSVEGAVPSEAAKDEIADFFSIELLQRGYAPMGRPQVRAALAEQQIEDMNETETPDLSTPEGAIAAGIALNVPAVLTITIPHFGDEISISAKILDVEDRSILWLAKGTGKGGAAFSSLFGSKSGNENEGLLRPVMGDVMGVTNEPLSAEDAKKTQRIIKNMCRSLPNKQVTKGPEW
jgi:hypothetical protein